MQLAHGPVTRGSQLLALRAQAFSRIVPALAHSFGLQQITHFVTEYVPPRCTVATTVLCVPHAETAHPIFTRFPRRRKEAFWHQGSTTPFDSCGAPRRPRSSGLVQGPPRQSPCLHCRCPPLLCLVLRAEDVSLMRPFRTIEQVPTIVALFPILMA